MGYTPISKTFRAPKCVIQANDLRLQRISVAAPGFLLPGPKPKGVQAATPIFEGIPKVEASSPQQTTEAATSSRLINTEEEEVVEVVDSEDEFEVFNQALSPETSVPNLGPPFSPIIDEMGIQRKPKSSLLDLIESQPGRDAPGKVTHSNPPTPPHALPFQTADLKRKREQKGKEVMGAGQTLPPCEDEAQRAFKQAKTGQRSVE